MGMMCTVVAQGAQTMSLQSQIALLPAAWLSCTLVFVKQLQPRKKTYLYQGSHGSSYSSLQRTPTALLHCSELEGSMSGGLSKGTTFVPTTRIGTMVRNTTNTFARWQWVCEMLPCLYVKTTRKRSLLGSLACL